MNAEDMLPKEGWAEVLSKLKDPQDIHACGQVCSLFKNVLDPKRTTLLFPMVFPVLKKHNMVSKKDEVPSLEFLEWRLVCPQWMRAIDQYCQGFGSCCVAATCCNICGPSELPLTYWFSTPTGLEDFMERFRDHPRNPFISRRVHVLYGATTMEMLRQEDFLPFWNAFRSLLEKFGEHLWSLGVNCQVQLPLDYYYRDFLHELLLCTPNLKALDVCGKILPYYNLREKEEQLIRLGSVIGQMPMPVLPNLESLKLNYLLHPVVGQLLKAAEPTKLRMLRLADGNFPFQTETVEYDLSRVADYYTNLDSVTFYDLSLSSSMTAISTSNWPLHKVSLRVHLGDHNIQRQPPDGITGLQLFDTLNKFGGTLKDLMLFLLGHFPYDGTGDMSDLRLQLPLLRKLTVELGSKKATLDSLNFAVELKELADLSLILKESFNPKKNPNQLIKFVGYEDRMVASNVWTILPKLVHFRLWTNDKDRTYRKIVERGCFSVEIRDVHYCDTPGCANGPRVDGENGGHDMWEGDALENILRQYRDALSPPRNGLLPLSLSTVLNVVLVALLVYALLKDYRGQA